jgi:hypothetical protein
MRPLLFVPETGEDAASGYGRHESKAPGSGEAFLQRFMPLLLQAIVSWRFSQCLAADDIPLCSSASAEKN